MMEPRTKSQAGHHVGASDIAFSLTENASCAEVDHGEEHRCATLRTFGYIPGVPDIVALLSRRDRGEVDEVVKTPRKVDAVTWL